MDLYTDKYFEKTANCVTDGTIATYGVFLRHHSVVAVAHALDYLTERSYGRIKIFRHFAEGALAPPETPLFSYQGNMREIVVLETQMLQRVGFACISAYNAYQMSMACPKVPFLDMAARHCAPDEGYGEGMIQSCAYGASIGSRTAQLQGAKGFVGSSLDLTAPLYADENAKGMGTMPHALIGVVGSTVDAMEIFVEGNPADPFVVVLVDYYGLEYSDALRCAEWFALHDWNKTKTLGVRLDTHGGRFAEGLNYDRSVEIVCEWLHETNKWSCVRHVMGDEAFDIADDNVRDQVAKTLFGTGVSLANIVQMRCKLDRAGHKNVKIIASSGFNVRKCRIMARAKAPIDMIGTGSFLPETLGETYATCDAVMFNDKPSVKVGREWLRDAVVPHWK